MTIVDPSNQPSLSGSDKTKFLYSFSEELAETFKWLNSITLSGRVMKRQAMSAADGHVVTLTGSRSDQLTVPER
jgi:hypothetical protein